MIGEGERDSGKEEGMGGGRREGVGKERGMEGRKKRWVDAGRTGLCMSQCMVLSTMLCYMLGFQYK